MDSELWRIWQVLLVVSVTFVEAWTDPHEHLHATPVFDDSQYVPGEPMTPIDFQNGLGIVADSPPKVDENGKYADPIEFAGLYEGDIILSSKRECADIEKNAIVNERQKWEQGKIPYVISSDFNSQQRGVIAKAMMEYHDRTCITFHPRSTEKDYIHIYKGSGCSSYVGRSGGAQPVSIGPGCEYTGIVVHELMHATGFWHEQSRYDRDDYVTVYFNNIQQGMEFNFQKYSWKDAQNLSVTYDLNSVMHYGPYAFSKSQGRPTILPKDPNKTIGQRSGFSTLDVEKVNKLYKCRGGGGGSRPSTTTLAPTTKPPSQCIDYHRHCAYWAKRGECSRNPAWMKANCRSSCSQCHKPCEDLNKYCVRWARRGECGRNPDYMLTYCRKSCNTCPSSISPEEPSTSTTTTTTDPSTSSSCVDSHRHCKYWADHGECETNPKYMHINCPNSCRLC